MKWFLTATIGASALLTMLMPLTGNITEHYVIFITNGFLQAGIWGIILKIFTLYLPARLLPTANQIMTAGPAVSGALAYGVAAVFGDNWKTPFFILSMLMGFIFTSLYFTVNNNLDLYLKEVGGFSNSTAKLLTILAPICAVIGPLMTVRSCERHRNL